MSGHQRHGKISDKLRRLFTKDEILHDPHPDRAAQPPSASKPKGVQGVTHTKPNRNTKNKKQ